MNLLYESYHFEKVILILGTDLMMGRKRIVLSIPFYYFSATKEWSVAAGIGVKIGK